MRDIGFSSLSELAAGLRNGEHTSVALTQHFLERIARFDAKAHAYVAVYAESAMLQAQAADLQRKAGLPLAPLHGLPIAIKDLCEIAGHVTTCGSLAWKDRVSPVTSTVVERLQAAGMIVLGKTHMVEFAFGGWGINPLMGTPRNPWDWNGQHRTPGGSSSGSGVAVAAGLAPAAIGSDTGGSVRIPAAFNGLTGLKTTHGLISLHGALPLSPTLDTIGTLTRTAEDAAMLTDALAGFDRRDRNTHHRPYATLAPIRSDGARGLRVAVMTEERYPWPVGDDVRRAVGDAVKGLASLGARVEPVDVPFDFAELMRYNGAITAAEAYRFHADYIEDESRPFGPIIKGRIMNGKAIGAGAYLAALAHRADAIARFEEWMRAFDLLVTPSVPFVACPLDEADEGASPVLAFSRAVNYLDACAISLPAGFSGGGLPIGVQLIAKPWHEAVLLQAARAFQEATDWHRRTPPALTDRAG